MSDGDTVALLKTVIDDETATVNCTSLPKYLLPFMNDSKIIFVHKPKQIPEVSLCQEKFRNKFDSDSEELDYTGQPLECPFSSDDDEPSVACYVKPREEHNHFPLSLLDARKMMAFYNLSLSLSEPLCILTDGSDKDHTVLLGVVKKDRRRSRFWINQQDFASNAAAALNVENMIKKHCSLSFTSRYTWSEVSCKYSVESVDNQMTFLVESMGQIEIDVFWKTPSFNIPLKEALVKITVNACVGNEASEISVLWSHITLLYDYLQIINKFKPDSKVDELYSRYPVNFPNIKQLEMKDGEVCDTKSVRDRLIQLLQDPNKITGEVLPNKVTENTKISLEEAVANIVSGKKEQEFTDQLWTLLIECASYSEVCTCLDAVFQYVQNGTCKPYIKCTNISRLAEALRRCRNDPEHFQMIFEPLELLIEIGIEKLKKEFVSVFLLAKIATSDQLSVPQLPKFPKVNASDWVDNCSKWITWLLRIHVSLQLMLLTESSLKCKSSVIPLTSSTLEHYLSDQSPILELTDPRVITAQSFTTSVNTKDLQDFLNKKTPFNSWTLKLSSEESNRKVVSIFYRNLDDLFPSSVMLVDDAETENGTFMLNALPYHCYEYHSVSDLF